jgi:hypothetical protein
MSSTATATVTNTYNIHWNGDIPYVVHNFSEEKKLHVVNDELKLSHHFEYDQFYPGEDTYHLSYYSDPMFAAFPHVAPIGSTCLFVKDDQYTLIGKKIFTFSLQPGDSFVAFCNVMGNSDVPYSYIIGKQYVYFFTADRGNVVTLPANRCFEINDKGEFDYHKDPYTALYEEDVEYKVAGVRRSRTLCKAWYRSVIQGL